MEKFRKAHGISLVHGSWIKNLHVERLTDDPTELIYPGRIWFNLNRNQLMMSIFSEDNNTVIAKSISAFTSENIFIDNRPAAKEHLINHGLKSENIRTTLWIKNLETGKWQNDLIFEEIEDEDHISVSLSEEQELKVIVQKMD